MALLGQAADLAWGYFQLRLRLAAGRRLDSAIAGWLAGWLADQKKADRNMIAAGWKVDGEKLRPSFFILSRFNANLPYLNMLQFLL